MTAVVLRLTRSQQMALIDVLLEYARDPEKPQLFVDCSSDEGTATTTGDLLVLVSDLRELEVTR